MANSKHEEVPAVQLLEKWLVKNRLSVPGFAKLIKRDGQLVHAWRYRRANPGALDMLAVESITGIALTKWLTKKQARRMRQIKDEYKALMVAKEEARKARLDGR